MSGAVQVFFGMGRICCTAQTRDEGHGRFRIQPSKFGWYPLMKTLTTASPDTFDGYSSIYIIPYNHQPTIIFPPFMSYIPMISGMFDGEPKPHIYQKKALGASEFDSVHGGCQFFKGNLQMSIGCTKNQPLIMIWGYTIQYYWG